MAKNKVFNTNIIIRTTKDLKRAFIGYCNSNNTNVSKEFNDYMLDRVTNGGEQYTMVGKGHPLYGYHIPTTLYEEFNRLQQREYVSPEEEQEFRDKLKQYK